MNSIWGNSGRQGFTLMELVLFTALFGVITTSFIAIFVTITRVQTQQGTTIGVNQESRFLMDTIQRLVRESSLIEIPINSGDSGQILKLRMSSDAEDPTYVRYDDTTGLVTIQVTETGPEEPLISNRVKVSNLVFTKLSNPDSKDVLELSFTMATSLDTDSSNYVSRDYGTSIARVASAIFESDIDRSSDTDPALVIGDSSDQFESINNTAFFGPSAGPLSVLALWFSLPYRALGIGPYKFSPQEQLHIADGGIQLDPGTFNRPTCTASYQGLLWFTPGDDSPSESTDKMQLCMRYDASTYFWTGEFPVFSSPQDVDTEGTAGEDIDIAAHDTGVGEESVVYVVYYKNRTGVDKGLWFSRSDNSGRDWIAPVDIHTTITNSGIGHHGSITVPEPGTVYVSYYDQNDGGLWFAKSTDWGNDGTWTKQLVVDGPQALGQYTSITAPTVNDVYISYYDGSNSDLRLAYSHGAGESGTWSDVYVDGAGVNRGKFSSIDSLDANTFMINYYAPDMDSVLSRLFLNGPENPSGNPYMVYQSYNNIGKSNDLVLVSPQTAVASVYDNVGNKLYFARTDNGNTSPWSSTLVHGSNRAGENNSITTINGDVIYIGYHIPGQGLFAAASYNGGENWEEGNEIDVTGGEVGQYTSMAGTPRGNYFIGYYHNTGSTKDAYATKFVSRPLFQY